MREPKAVTLAPARDGPDIGAHGGPLEGSQEPAGRSVVGGSGAVVLTEVC